MNPNQQLALNDAQFERLQTEGYFGVPKDQQGWFDKLGGWDGVGNIADLIGSFGNIYGAVQGVKLARDQLDFTKGAYKTNLHNQAQAYNTSLADRAYARAHTQGDSRTSAQNYIEANAMSGSQGGKMTSRDLDFMRGY